MKLVPSSSLQGSSLRKAHGHVPYRTLIYSRTKYSEVPKRLLIELLCLENLKIIWYFPYLTKFNLWPYAPTLDRKFLQAVMWNSHQKQTGTCFWFFFFLTCCQNFFFLYVCTINLLFIIVVACDNFQECLWKLGPWNIRWKIR